MGNFTEPSIRADYFGIDYFEPIVTYEFALR